MRQIGGNQPAAKLEFQKAADLVPAFAPAYLDLGIASAITGDAERALEYFEQAKDKDNTMAEVHFMLGKMYQSINPIRAGVHFDLFIDFAYPYLAKSKYVAYARMHVEHGMRMFEEILSPEAGERSGKRQDKEACPKVWPAGREIIGSAGCKPIAIPSYETITTRFRENLAKLAPASAYQTLFEATYSLLQAAQLADSAPPRELLVRSSHAIQCLNAAYRAYAAGDSAGAKLAATELMAGSEVLDPRSLGDAKHLLGRLQFDEGQATAAGQAFEDVLGWCRESGYAEGFIRALHEISRVKAKGCQLLDAEAGFRIAADYYSLRMLKRRGQQEQAADESDQRNLTAALECLAGLADDYLLISDGPVEGDHLIESLARDFLQPADGSGDDFLIIRSLALKLLTADEAERGMVELLAKGVALFGTRRRLSIFSLDEAVWFADRRNISYPSKIRNVLVREQPFSLRASPSFKPVRHAVVVEPPPLRHLTINDATDSIQSLYEYLSALDGAGRYVYRGQTQEYDAPLLPSTFRPILRTDYGVAVRRASGVDDPRRLRRCGVSFVGEYNYCFSRYGDVLRQEREGGMEQSEIDRILGVYRKLLRDSVLALFQDREEYVPWAELVRRELSEADLRTYEAYATEWNPRIDNFHKRRFRNELLVRLFGYTLGTTFAQQFGLSSEGLDATKSLEVACFFASRDSVDFQRVADSGVGVLYRFPFPPNDVAMQPLSNLSFYSLPSIVDVEDVFYRFEQAQLEQADAMPCVRAYVKARLTYHADSTDTLMLPREFLSSSRVKAQESVIIMPDEVREDLTDREPGIDGIRYPKFRFIEDLKTRPGLTRFYFRHNGRGVEIAGPMTRERLWPRDDFLPKTLILLTAGRYRLSEAIPKRLDLIDGGYSPDEFLANISELYTNYRYSFLDPSSDLSRHHFHVIQA
jgi:hypothetical protein